MAPPPGPASNQTATGSDGEPPAEVLREPSAFHPTAVERRGAVVVKDAGPWTPAVHALLRHLEAAGFEGAPRLVGPGLDADGRQTLSYVEGDFVHPGPWSLEGAAAVGGLLRRLHDATASFRPPPDAVWFPWYGRDLGGPRHVIGHRDTGPWNIVARDGLPVALIDWDWAGPVDPLVELAEAAWLNAQLHADDVAEAAGLPPLAERARHLRAIVDGYGLGARQRRGLFDRIVEVAAHATAWEVDEAHITEATTPDEVEKNFLWAFAWHARGLAWMLRHRRSLENALA